jgi:hypothetical protein
VAGCQLYAENYGLLEALPSDANGDYLLRSLDPRPLPEAGDFRRYRLLSDSSCCTLQYIPLVNNDLGQQPTKLRIYECGAGDAYTEYDSNNPADASVFEDFRTGQLCFNSFAIAPASNSFYLIKVRVSKCPEVNCEDFSENFTGGLSAKTRLGSGIFLNGLPATNPTNGVYDPSVGRTSLGSVKAGGFQENPPNHCFTLVCDLGRSCTLNNITFWGKSSNGNAPYVVIRIYNFTGSPVAIVQEGFFGGGTDWWFGQWNVNASNIRYFAIVFEGNQSVDFWIDDIACGVST